ncbi:MAG TPA: hypothetical protein VE549_12705 [Myxococcaceae bacterium]|jgi:hypothetical protein|nr:hypothetical protein [Myxococcaceae bacterium]
MRHVAIAVVLLTASAAAEDTSPAANPADTLFVEGLAGGSIRREGAIADLRLRYRHRLFDSSDAAFRDNYLGAGLITLHSPVFSQNGVYLELAPASFARLTAAYQWVAYFGTFNSLRPLSDCADVSTLAAEDPRCAFPAGITTSENGPSFADYGHRAWVEALLQIQLGPLIAYDSFGVERWSFRSDWAAGPGYEYWFNELHTVPMHRRDIALTNSAAVLYEIRSDDEGTRAQILSGVAVDLAYAYHAKYLRQRVGVVGVYRLPRCGPLRDAAAALLVQWYTHDRYLRGPLPFVGLVFSASTANLLRRLALVPEAKARGAMGSSGRHLR